LLTCGPARIIQLDAGSLAPGKAADLCIFNPDATFIYSADRIRSKSKNSPFIGWELPGVVHYTLVNGRIVYPD
jgi:dihydroorotase